MLSPLYLNNKGLFYSTGLKTVGILTVLSIVAFIFRDNIQDYWGGYLFLGLISVLVALIVEVVLTYFGKIKTDSKYGKTLSYIIIVLFIFYILYDTKKIIQGANNCVNPDYINNSLDLVLDSLNIFTNVYRNND